MSSQTKLDLPTQVAALDPQADARRAEYRRRLAEKLKDPEFRKIEGFPIGTDEAILALSDPPRYTACPNPFLDEWLAEHGKPYDAATDEYHREPFAADVSEGKNDPIYNAHSYHTKVPHKAIMRYILHYTQPGDVVYDGFCGTGMTGVAAQLCGDRAAVESLQDPVDWDAKGKVTKSQQAYFVDGKAAVWDRLTWAAKRAIESGKPNPHPHIRDPKPFSTLGARKAVLNDLSPAATFIAYNYNTTVDVVEFERVATMVLAEVEAEFGWMYTALHGCSAVDVAYWAERIGKCQTAQEAREVVGEIPAGKRAVVGSVVWATAFSCPNCASELTLWGAPDADDEENAALRCPGCQSTSTRSQLDYSTETMWDDAESRIRTRIKRLPVRIATTQRGAAEKSADDFDAALDRLVSRLPVECWHPREKMLRIGAQWGDTYRSGYHTGYERVDDFYFARTKHVLSKLWERFSTGAGSDNVMKSLVTAVAFSATHLYRYRTKGGGSPAGNLYVPALINEQNVFKTLARKAADLARATRTKGQIGEGLAVTTASIGATANSRVRADYIFVDPPFGKNIMYSESNFLWESWLRVATCQEPEAIVNASQGKSAADYERLMRTGFAALFEALHPGRWMTVEFHNSENGIWHALQMAIEGAGFLVADVRVLDKKQKAYKQVSTRSAAKQDLVISCYKPTTAFDSAFSAHQGTPAAVRDFLEQHLAMLPVAPVTKSGRIEMLAERTTSLLYDRMIAYHLVRGAPIPISAPDFTRLLDDLCVDRDGMWFLPGQEARYDALKMRGVAVEQLSVFVQDEKSAIAWVRNEIAKQPQTLGELTPQFMQALKEWPKHEPRPELRDLLRDSFVEDEDGHWQLPDPDNERHLQQLRNNSLLKQFRGYCESSGKLLAFRKEAVLAGFQHCWQTDQPAVIVQLCRRMKPEHLQLHQDLMLFHDVARQQLPDTDAPEPVVFVWD
jgi:hypothetical protein